MHVLIVILAVLDIIVCVGLVTLVALQEGDEAGLGSLAGNFETFMDKSNGGSFEEKLQKLTTVLAISFAVLSIILYLLTGRVA